MAPAPKPPPTRITCPLSGRGAGCPSGPAQSRLSPPPARAQIGLLVLPAAWTTMVMVPASRSKFVMLIGTRSPDSFTRRMTNWPGQALRATRGAATTKSLVTGVRWRFSLILAMCLGPALCPLEERAFVHRPEPLPAPLPLGLDGGQLLLALRLSPRPRLSHQLYTGEDRTAR